MNPFDFVRKLIISDYFDPYHFNRNAVMYI